MTRLLRILDAIASLESQSSPRAVIHALAPALSSHGVTHTDVWEHHGTHWTCLTGEHRREPPARFAAAIERHGAASVDHRVAPERGALVAPLSLGCHVVAVIEIHDHGDAPLQNARAGFTEEVRRAFRQVVAHQRARALAGLADALRAAEHLRSAADATLQVVLPMLDASGGAALQMRGLDLTSVATAGEVRVPVRLTDPERDRVLRGEHVTRPEGTFLPLLGRARPRALVWLQGRALSRDDTDDLAFVLSATRLFTLEWQHFETRAHLNSLLDIQRKLLSVPVDLLYQPLLEAAVQLVPGAECGSLLVRHDDRFHYRGVVGYEQRELQHVSFLVADTRDRWYGLGREAWEAGVPRTISRAGMLSQGVGYQLQGVRVEDILPSIQPVQASIAMPILYEGEVYALINIDSHSDVHAFGADSIDVARAFGVQAALLMHEARQRQQIEQAARTDILTGLQNRRAFNESLERHVASARRHQLPLALLVIDLKGFKALNDQLGHAVGDEALVLVARALASSVRAGDEVFRWGGDEFAALLPHTDGRGAVHVAQRFAHRIREITLHGVPLNANVGVAWAQRDPDGARLLRDADEAMYTAKRRGVPVSESTQA